MKRWIEALLGLVILVAWAGVALSASEATRRDAAAVTTPDVQVAQAGSGGAHRA